MSNLLDSFDTVDKHAQEPLYQQIKNIILHRIRSGDWLAGQKLPSENELVSALGVSRMTIHRALRELTQEGLINRVHGLGSFVAIAPRHASLIELKDIAIEVAQSGRRHASQVLSLYEVAADATTAMMMQLPAASPLFYLGAVHYQDELPIALESRFVNPTLVPAFLEQDYSSMTSTSYLLKQFRPQEMEHIVRAIMPDTVMQQMLRITADEPCLQLSRRTWNFDLVVTHVSMTYPSSRYELGARYATDDFPVRSSATA